MLLSSHLIGSRVFLTFGDWAETLRGLPKELEQMIKINTREDQQFIDFFPLKNFTIKDFFSNTLRQMESFEYDPPDDSLDILDHLWVQWTYYQKIWSYPPTLKDMIIDLSLWKLMGAAYLKFAILMQKGKDLPRTKKSTVTKKSKAQQLDGDISEVFYHLTTRGMSKNKIGKIIREKLIKKYGQNVPSVKTIVRHLEANQQFRKDLIAEGVLEIGLM